MRRLIPPSLLLAVLAALPSAAGAQTSQPTPARGTATLVATDRGVRQATFLSGRTVDVTVTYRRRSSSRSVRLAARFGQSGRCPRRPAAADRRRLGTAVSDGRAAYVTATGRARFRSGANRSCVWAKEGSGGYRRPTTITGTFARSLFAATAAEGTQSGLAVTAYAAQSTQPIVGTLSVEGLGGPGCEIRTRPATSRLFGTIHSSTLSTATGSACTRLGAQLSSGTDSASLAVGPTAVGAPTRVVQHVGDCNPDITRSVPVPAADAKAVLEAAGCRLGRVIPGKSEGRANAGLPPSGTVYLTQYRDRLVPLAPRGTTIDVLVDVRR